MKLHYFVSPVGNFGDDLNEWIWDDLLPGWRDWRDDTTLIGVGTILNKRRLPPGRKLVVGSGFGYGDKPEMGDPAEWDVRAVRGPKTCRELGLPDDLGLGDPAILLPRIERFKNMERGEHTLFVPHVGSDHLYQWSRICADIGLQYQSPSAPAEDVIRQLASAKQVVAESMHAAIIADAFGTPWRAVEINREFNRFKWGDWAETVGLTDLGFYRFFPALRWAQDKLRKRTPVPEDRAGPGTGGTKRARRSMQKGAMLQTLARWHLTRSAMGPFRLSDRARLSEAQDRLTAMLGAVASDYTGM